MEQNRRNEEEEDEEQEAAVTLLHEELLMNTWMWGWRKEGDTPKQRHLVVTDRKDRATPPRVQQGVLTRKQKTSSHTNKVDMPTSKHNEKKTENDSEHSFKGLKQSKSKK